MGQPDNRLDRSAARGRRTRLLAIIFLPVGLLAALGGLGLWLGEESQGPLVSGWPCPPQPTAALPFDPADGAQLAAHATDIFVGRVVGVVAGPDPAAPVPGAPPDVPARHLRVEVLATEKGNATGAVVVHQAIEPGDEGCLRGVYGDSLLEVGNVRHFVAVRDEPTGTYNLFAGPYSHRSPDAPLGPGTP